MASPSERDVIERITRYSALRAAERAVRPSVRLRRRRAAASSLGLDLLRDLQELMDAVQDGKDLAELECSLAEIDSGLDELDALLDELVGETPISEFRATLPSVTETNHAEATALLDFSVATASRRHQHLSLIDYMVTLLASDRAEGARTLRLDPPSVSAGMARLAESLSGEIDSEIAKRFRDASYEVLEADDVISLVDEMRNAKASLADRFFEADVLRSIVVYNLAVSNRLDRMLEAERRLDRGVVRLRQALCALDGEAGPPDE